MSPTDSPLTEMTGAMTPRLDVEDLPNPRFRGRDQWAINVGLPCGDLVNEV